MNIKTERLTIGPYSDADSDDMIRLLTNQEIRKNFMIPDFTSEEEARQMFQKLKSFSSAPGHYEAGIYLKNKLIGFVNDVEIKGDSIEMGYVCIFIHKKQEAFHV